jgi:hypothetical protein
MHKSHFARCISDFPLLWGIKQDWHYEEDVIEIHIASLEIFDQDIRVCPWDLWVYGCAVRTSPEDRWIKENRYTLKKAAVVGSLHQLGSIALNAATTWLGKGLEHVALSRPIEDKPGALHAQIFRIPRGTTTFWDFLQDYDLCGQQRVSEEGGRDGN